MSSWINTRLDLLIKYGAYNVVDELTYPLCCFSPYENWQANRGIVVAGVETELLEGDPGPVA